MNPWLFQQMRITVFTSESQADRAESWWQSAVQSTYDNKNIRAGGTVQNIEGPWEGARLGLNVELSRADWVAAVPIDPMSDLSDVPVLGEFDKVVERIVPLVQKWLPEVKAITRLAFGGVIVSNVSDRMEGYKALQKYLPSVKIDPEGSSDFQYRINRARTSKVLHGLRINRLQTWSVLALRQFSVPLVGLTNASEARAHLAPAISACRLEFDINTELKSDALPADSVGGIFNELISFAKDLSINGDVR